MKDKAIWMYRMMTRSRRGQILQQLRAEASLPVGILFYHRIADSHPNDWTMSCDDFALQLDWLQSHYDIVSLDVAQQRIREGTNRRTVAITFDDGYGDNANFAIPTLIERGLTATYFVSTDFVKHQRPFSHDVEAGVPLAPNTIEQLREFSAGGIEIGAHTCSHCDMGKTLEPSSVQNEIVGGAEQLEAWLGKRPRYFAFPYGLPANTSQVAVDTIQEFGFRGFCTAYGAWNWPPNSEYGEAADESSTTLGYHMRRIHADPGIERLKNWLTLDTRKFIEDVELPFQVREAAQDHTTARVMETLS